MRKEYAFANAVRSPYPKLLRRRITFHLDPGTIAYFQDFGEEADLPHQTLISLYLKVHLSPPV